MALLFSLSCLQESKGVEGTAVCGSMAHPPSLGGEFWGVWENRKHSTEPADQKR